MPTSMWFSTFWKIRLLWRRNFLESQDRQNPMNPWRRDRLSLLRFFGWKASEIYQTAVVNSKTWADYHLQSFLEHVHFTTKDERTETKATDSPSSPTRAPTFALRDADFAVEVETLSSHFQRTLLDPQVGFLARSKNSSKSVFHTDFTASSFISFGVSLHFLCFPAPFYSTSQHGHLFLLQVRNRLEWLRPCPMTLRAFLCLSILAVFRGKPWQKKGAMNNREDDRMSIASRIALKLRFLFTEPCEYWVHHGLVQCLPCVGNSERPPQQRSNSCERWGAWGFVIWQLWNGQKSLTKTSSAFIHSVYRFNKSTNYCFCPIKGFNECFAPFHFSEV